MVRPGSASASELAIGLPAEDAAGALLAKVQAATGPNYALEEEIHRMLVPEDQRTIIPPAYTVSLDAAISLVGRCLPGWVWEIRTWREGNPEACLCEFNIGNQDYEAEGATPALALLGALLSALAPALDTAAQPSPGMKKEKTS